MHKQGAELRRRFVGEERVTAHGRSFAELRQVGWKAFKEARDAPFQKPWLES